MATTSPLATSTTACIHRTKHPWRALGEGLIMTIQMQSCEGTPLANGKYFRSQLSGSLGITVVHHNILCFH
jgi:hypothetical protein